MNKQQLANRIWASANNMRNKIDANEYKDYILGLIFYKFLSDTEVKYFTEVCGWTQEDLPELVEDYSDMNMRNAISECQNSIGFFIEYKHLFSTWLNDDKFSVQTLSEALSNFERLMSPNYESVYDGIFKTLREGLSKLGDNPSSQTRALKELIRLIKDIPTDGSQDYDVLGYVYEYLISNFAASAGKKAGEFYTPHEVAMVMSEIVAEHHKDKESLEIYDPTSGSGSLLITIGKAVSKHIEGKNKVKYYAQELKENTYNLTRMNLVMRGIIPQNIVTRCADTLEDDWPIHEEGSEIDKPLAVDAVVSNPPYSQHWDPSDKEMDARFLPYGVAPKTKADYAFLLHELHHLHHDGILTIVLPHGVLFRGKTPKEYDKDGKQLPIELHEEGQAEGKIRAKLIEKNNIDAVIGLPAGIFFGTGIPTIIMVLKKNRGDEGVLIIDASKGFVKDGKQNKLRACDVKKIADTYSERKSIPGYSRVVTRDEIRNNDYNLNIPRYVDSSEPAVKYDIYSTMFGGIPNNEIDELGEYWNTFGTLREELFSPFDGRPYSFIPTDNVIETIRDNGSVKEFKNRFSQAFCGLKNMLCQRLIDHVDSVSDVADNDAISEDIFRRAEQLPLIDKYEAYQILADNWQSIMGDVEIIQTEGIGACNVVEPKMKMVKDRNGIEQEVQDGLKGRIIPFELVQTVLFPELYAEVIRIKQEISRNEDEIQSLVESVPDDLSEILNDDNTYFDTKKLIAKYKELIADLSTPEIDVLNGYLALSKKKDKLNYMNFHSEIDWCELCNGNEVCKATCVKNHIANLKKQFEFNEESFENLIVKALNGLDKIKELKDSLISKNLELLRKTIETIEGLGMKEINLFLELKWVEPITSAIEALPDALLQKLADSVTALNEKYSVTYNEIENRIEESEKDLASLIDQLTGDEFAIAGLSNLIRK